MTHVHMCVHSTCMEVRGWSHVSSVLRHILCFAWDRSLIGLEVLKVGQASPALLGTHPSPPLIWAAVSLSLEPSFLHYWPNQLLFHLWVSGQRMTSLSQPVNTSNGLGQSDFIGTGCEPKGRADRVACREPAEKLAWGSFSQSRGRGPGSAGLLTPLGILSATVIKHSAECSKSS